MTPSTILTRALAPFRQNRRLLWGVLVIALIVASEGWLRWRDTVDARAQRLLNVRKETSQLKSRTYNEKSLQQSLDALSAQQKALSDRLWVVSSEAAAQARMKDWLNQILATHKLISLDIKVSASRPLPLKTPDQWPIHAMSATLSVPFTPVSGESLLASIEGGAELADIESLQINMRDRRLQVGVRVLLVMQQPGSDSGGDRRSGTTANLLPAALARQRDFERTQPASGQMVHLGVGQPIGRHRIHRLAQRS